MTNIARRGMLVIGLAVSPIALWMVLGWRSLFGWLVAVALIAAIFLIGKDLKSEARSAADDLL